MTARTGTFATLLRALNRHRGKTSSQQALSNSVAVLAVDEPLTREQADLQDGTAIIQALCRHADYQRVASQDVLPNSWEIGAGVRCGNALSQEIVYPIVPCHASTSMPATQPHFRAGTSAKNLIQIKSRSIGRLCRLEHRQVALRPAACKEEPAQREYVAAGSKRLGNLPMMPSP